MNRSPQLPPGTRVVLREPVPDGIGGTVQRGATGRVAALAADGRYRLRLADGREAAVRREQVSLRRAYQHDVAISLPTGADDAASLVRDHTIHAAVVGSRAFGLATDDSDTDIRGRTSRRLRPSGH